MIRSEKYKTLSACRIEEAMYRKKIMPENDLDVYRRLQQHLDRQAVGFPPTASGAEIRILRHIFTPEEAEIAVCLSYRFEPVETIYERSAHLVNTPGVLAARLDHIRRKGGIESRIRDGRILYCLSPLVVGMYEMQSGRLTPAFIKDFNEYTRNRRFGVEFLGTALPQMRTIPIAKSITARHQAAPYDAVSALLEHAEAPFVILECICRRKKEMEGGSCRVTHRKETCLAIGGIAQSILLGGAGREIHRREVMAIIEKNQQEGLVLQPSNSQKAEFICSCCGCCCGMLNMHRKLPSPLEYWAANFHAVVDPKACNGCGLCERRCQVGAIRMPGGRTTAEVEMIRCIGCGVCVAACPGEAIRLEKKLKEIRPPRTREDLYDIIMARKKGRLEKLELTGRLLVDAVRAGGIDLLRRLVR